MSDKKNVEIILKKKKRMKRNSGKIKNVGWTEI